MGCGKSVPQKNRRKSSLGAIFHRQKVSLRVGNEVKIYEDSPVIVFVFGGPGTKKGKLVEDLTQSYGFKLINLEKIMLKELGKNDDEVGNTANEIIDYVKESPEKVTLRWALGEVKKIIEGDKEASYIIDLMPNLKSLVRSPGLVKDPTFELKNFESFFPISFAINFAIPLDKMVKKKKEPECVKGPGTEQGSGKKEGGGGKSDEADSGRTKRRATLFDSSVRPFVDYFQKSGRLVNIDVSCGMLDLIWERVCEVFTELDVSNCNNANTVIIFAFDDKTLNEIELGNYSIHYLDADEFIQAPDEPPEKILTSLSRVIDKFDPAVKGFAVNLSGTSLAQKLSSDGKKHIVFVDEDTSKLDTHVKMQLKGEPCVKKFKAVSSLENQVCLFPQDTDAELCKNIALFLAKCRLNFSPPDLSW